MQLKYLKLVQIICGIGRLIAVRLELSLPKTQFKYLKLVQIICGIGSLISVIDFRESEDESIESTVARPTLRTNDAHELILLLVGRYCAFSLYPVVSLVMFTKYRATQTALNSTGFSVFLTQKTHDLHVYCGWYILVGSIIHTISHCLRWMKQGNIQLLSTNRSGITGLIVIISTFLIVAPMTILKKIVNYETRKLTHYLFWVFCIAMAFHAPIKELPQSGYCYLVFPILIGWYCLDAAYVKIFMSESIDSVEYKAVKGGVELTMMVSDRFAKKLNGGFGYVMAPWICKYQWHPFSIYQDPDDCRRRHMFIANLGDWTSKMHDTIESAPTARPLWISGPFPSPYNDCINYDNLIFVGSGVGITPAVSAIEKYRESRRCNLIWAVRDVSVLVFFLKKIVLDEKALNLIFYTGKEPLPKGIENYNLLHDAHIYIVKSRPDVKVLVPNIISYFENPSSDHNNPNRNPALTIGHGTEFPQKIPSTIECVYERTDLECLSISGLRSGYRGNDSFTSICSDPASLTLVNNHCNRQRISVHDVISIVEKTKLAAGDVALNDLEECNSKIGRKGSDEVASLPHPPSATNLGRLTSSVGLELKVWEENPSAREYLENRFPKTRRKTWGLLYCGSRNPILRNLKEESKAMKIRLHEEVFDW